ncbi:hypothetical protein SNE510_21790 [Streptomyces sp. NE5-10]|nr:hypothetical protein SNE510_21790 [Streptomyces sp. NE5-10]
MVEVDLSRGGDVPQVPFELDLMGQRQQLLPRGTVFERHVLSFTGAHRYEHSHMFRTEKRSLRRRADVTELGHPRPADAHQLRHVRHRVPVITKPSDAFLAHARGLDNSGLEIPHQLCGGLYAEGVILHRGNAPHLFDHGWHLADADGESDFIATC